MLPLLVLLDYLIPTLYRLSHLVGDVELHIVHSHLHYVVGLVYLLELLLGLVAEDLYLRLPTLLRLLQLIVEGPLSFGEQLFPTLFGYLLAETYFFVPFFF
jgi:hypothetical protein